MNNSSNISLNLCNETGARPTGSAHCNIILAAEPAATAPSAGRQSEFLTFRAPPYQLVPFLFPVVFGNSRLWRENQGERYAALPLEVNEYFNESQGSFPRPRWLTLAQAGAPDPLRWII